MADVEGSEQGNVSLQPVVSAINHMDVIAKCHRTGIPCYGLLFA